MPAWRQSLPWNDGFLQRVSKVSQNALADAGRPAKPKHSRSNTVSMIRISVQLHLPPQLEQLQQLHNSQARSLINRSCSPLDLVPTSPRRSLGLDRRIAGGGT